MKDLVANRICELLIPNSSSVSAGVVFSRAKQDPGLPLVEAAVASTCSLVCGIPKLLIGIYQALIIHP